MATDDERVQAFVRAWVLSELRPKAAEELHALIVQIREEPRPSSALDDVMKRSELRILELFGRLAPKGSNPSPAVLLEIREGIAQIFKDELLAAGMPEQGAATLAKMLVSATSFKPKE